MRQRHAFTLIELMVVMAVLAIIAAVTTPAFRRIEAPDRKDLRLALRNARRVALNTGHTVTIAVTTPDSVTHLLTAHPDGSVIADSMMRVDRLTARFRDETH